MCNYGSVFLVIHRSRNDGGRLIDMRIQYGNPDCLFGSLKEGDVFKVTDDSSVRTVKTVYIKFKNAICSDNALCLSNGTTHHFGDNTLVQKLDATLTVR